MIVVKWTTPEGVTITSPAIYLRLQDAFVYADALKGWPVAADAWVEADGVRIERIGLAHPFTDGKIAP